VPQAFHHLRNIIPSSSILILSSDLLGGIQDPAGALLLITDLKIIFTVSYPKMFGLLKYNNILKSLQIIHFKFSTEQVHILP
jgi:hypothetical protein